MDAAFTGFDGEFWDRAAGCIAVPYRGIKLGLSQKPLAAFL